MEARSFGKTRSIKDILQDRNIILRGADALSQKGFTQVPNYVLKPTRISPGAKLTYTMLLSYVWENEF